MDNKDLVLPPAYNEEHQPLPAADTKGYLPEAGYPLQQGYPPQGYPQPIQSQPATFYQQHQQGYTPVVMAAPQYIGPPPDNYSALAWLTCLFCCWPLGLVAIAKSMEVNSSVAQGDINRARNASEEARKYGYWALGCGVVINVIAAIIVVVYVVVLLPNINKYNHY